MVTVIETEFKSESTNQAFAGKILGIKTLSEQVAEYIWRFFIEIEHHERFLIFYQDLEYLIEGFLPAGNCWFRYTFGAPAVIVRGAAHIPAILAVISPGTKFLAAFEAYFGSFCDW